MRYRKLHEWPRDATQAVAIQKQLSSLVSLDDAFGEIKLVAGIDVGFPTPDTAAAGVVVLKFPEMEVVEERSAEVPVEFPYVPGLLAFRETPAVLAALEKVETEPDLLIIDGQGLAHPRRFGIACHVGVLTDKPTIGCAKSRLTGSYDEPDYEAGSWTPLVAKDGEVIGTVLRTRDGTKPVFVSPGHKVSIESATHLLMQNIHSHRIPEPTRLAHNLVSKTQLQPSKR